MKKSIIACLLVTSLILTLFGCQKAPEPVEDKDVIVTQQNYVEDEYELELIRSRICESNFDKEIDVTEILSNLQEDGSFKNIEYNSERKDDWQPINHLKNILKLQKAYYTPENTFYQNEDIKTGVTNAIKYWIDGDFHCDWNHWYNDIGIGMYLPDILLFGVDGLTAEQTDNLLSEYKKTLIDAKPYKEDIEFRFVDDAGGNLTDQVIATLKIAVIEKDYNKIMWLTSVIENELQPFPSYVEGKNRTDYQGIKEDMSFQQHDQMLYAGSYGSVFMSGINRYLSYTIGTQYVVDDKALNLYADFILDGMQYYTRNGFFDISISGRAISRKGALKGLEGNIKNAANILIKHNDMYNNIERVQELENMLTNHYGDNDLGAGGHKYFYESDYSVYNDKNYMATVRHSSNRTRIYEYLNEENPLAYYTGFGATFYYVKGDEYFDVAATYDWNKIPGTTTRQGYLPQLDEIMSYATYNNTKDVSGVTNGKVGSSFVMQNRDRVKVNQSYFMFEKGVVCLGSDINSSTINPIATTINQANFVDNAIISQNGSKTEIGLNTQLDGKFDYVYHNGISYITDAQVSIEAMHKTGDWKTVSTRRKSEPTERDLFTLYINHGRIVHNKTYDYTVLMNTTPEMTDSYIANPTLITISNNKICQAVYDTENDILQAVFHSAGSVELPNGTKVNVNSPCTLILENGTDLTISTHNFTEYDVEVAINDVAQTISVDKTSKSYKF